MKSPFLFVFGLAIIALGTMSHRCGEEHDAPIIQKITKTLSPGQSFSLDLPGDKDDVYQITQAAARASASAVSGHSYSYTAGPDASGDDLVELTATEQHASGHACGGHHGDHNSRLEAKVTIHIHISSTNNTAASQVTE